MMKQAADKLILKYIFVFLQAASRHLLKSMWV